MPLVEINLKPGVDGQSTPWSSPAGWNESANIRFFQGLPQKAGGFKKFCQAVTSPTDPALGRSAVELRAWAALSGIRYLAIGGENRISLFAADVVSDITPNTTYTLVPMGALSTTSGSQTVKITDPLDTPAAGDWIRIRAPVSVAGIILDGPYRVVAVIDPTHYTITSAVAANATVNDAGVTRTFATTADSATVAVALPDHGLFSGQIARVTNPVPAGGLVLEGNYVATVVDAGHYTIDAGAPATSTETVNENNGNLALTFYHPTAGAQNALEVESIDLDNWGEFLLAIPLQGPVFVWKPTDGPGKPAQNVLTAPQANTAGFVSGQQQILVLCGSVNLATGLFDPMLVRWSDSGDYTQFVPLVTNQAGSYRLQLGSEIVAGLAVAGRGLVWTDLAVYGMQYEGIPLVWGFQPIGVNCGLIGPKAMGVLTDTVAWMSQNQFYVLAGGGAPQVIPCNVWDLVFKNIDKANARQSVCTTNAFFGEVAWYVPQSDGTTTRARLNISSGLWDYTIIEASDNANRSAGIDQNVFGPPFGATPSGAVYQEETGTDADDGPLKWRLLSGIATIAQGDQIAFFREIIPDIKFSNDQAAGPGTVQMLVYVYRDPQAAPRIKGPYPINARTRVIPCRGRGRGLQFEFFGSDKGSAPRLGMVSYRAQADGRSG
jgi:hypothetical protein